MSRIINHLYFLSIYLMMKFFCWIILVILMPDKVFFGFAIFSANFSSKFFFFLYFTNRWTSFLASFYISQSILRRLDLNFLNNLSLKLNFSAISLSNHSLLVFFVVIVFKGAILFTTSIRLGTKLLYALCTLLYYS